MHFFWVVRVGSYVVSGFFTRVKNEFLRGVSCVNECFFTRVKGRIPEVNGFVCVGKRGGCSFFGV